MRAIAMKAAGEPRIPAILESVRRFCTAKCVTIAAIGAAVCYAGCLTGSDLTMYSGAFAALLAVRPMTEKGGEA